MGRERLLAALALCVVLAACRPGLDQLKPALGIGDRGTLWFRTDDGEILSAELDFPSGDGPFAAVILMHGCSGLPSRAIDGWVPELHRWGYATLVVDSFFGRRMREACTNALELPAYRRIADAWGALRMLATHPRIDRERVALMGFSHGGIAALGAGSEWARRTYGGTPGATFRAFLPFYPYCNARAPEQSWGVAAPVRIHVGALDDWTPARTCRELVATARAAAFDMDIVVYQNASHSFDAVGLATQRLPHVDNAADCTPELATLRGPILNLFALRHCIRKGATVGWSPEATEQARRNVRAQLADLLR